MGILKRIEQAESIPLLMSWIEDDDFVQVGVIVLLVSCQEDICSEIWEHLSNAMHEHVWMMETIILCDVLLDSFAYILDEIIGVGFCGQLICHHVWSHLVLVKSIFQQGLVTKLLFL